MKEDEKLKLGYDGAMRMMSTEGRVIWSAFRTLVAVNSFLVAVAGAVAAVYPHRSWIASLMAGAGIAICITWWLVLARQFEYFRYWVAWARHLEEEIFAPEAGMLSRGRAFGQGASVKLSGREIRMSWPGRPFRVQWLMSLLIGLFLVLYVLVLVVANVT